MKQKKFIMFFMIAMLGITLICGCEKDNTKLSEDFLALEYPEEYLIYQDYLDVIGGVPSPFYKNIEDIGTIEATVISMTKSDRCPYQLGEKEECKIEPYPLDGGRVRIDKIIEYTKYSEQTVEENPIDVMEKPTNEKEQSEEEDRGEQVPEYKGKFVPKPKLIEYDPLQERQEVQAKFLISARPVKIIYTSIPPREEPEPSQLVKEQSATASEDPTTTAKESPISNDPTTLVSSGTINVKEPLPKVYKPIPKEGDYFVFTTKIIEYPETNQKVLPGLKEGDKFRAKITYNGILYLEEYELI